MTHHLSDADLWRIQKSDGYMDLKMLHQARAELAQVTEPGRAHTLFQQVRLRLAMEEKNWTEACNLARHLTEHEPKQPTHWIQLAYATRRLEGIEKALNILRKAHQQFPAEPVIPFNLACYECRMGHREEALHYLKQAERLSPKCRDMAMEDEDLKPLWTDLEEND